MATINDHVYTVEVELPHEGTIKFDIYANKQTAVEAAEEEAKQRTNGGSYATREIESPLFHYTFDVWAFEYDPEDTPSYWIRVQERVIR